MKLSQYTIGILGILLLSACGRSELQTDDGPAQNSKIGTQICTLIAKAGLVVQAYVPPGWDADTLRQELRIQVTDENGPVELSDVSGNSTDLSWAGAYEKQGPFQITATLRSVTSRPLTVRAGRSADGCHVEGAGVSINFAPPNMILLE